MTKRFIMSLDSQSVRTPAAAVQAVVVVHCLHPHLALPVVPASSVRNPFQHQLHVLGPLVQASAPPAPLHPVLSADALHVDTARALIGEKVRASSLGALGLVAQQPVDRRGSKGREDSLSCWRMNGRSDGRGATPPPPPPSKESSEELYGGVGKLHLTVQLAAPAVVVVRRLARSRTAPDARQYIHRAGVPRRGAPDGGAVHGPRGGVPNLPPLPFSYEHGVGSAPGNRRGTPSQARPKPVRSAD